MEVLGQRGAENLRLADEVFRLRQELETIREETAKEIFDEWNTLNELFWSGGPCKNYDAGCANCNYWDLFTNIKEQYMVALILLKNIVPHRIHLFSFSLAIILL